MPKFRPIPKNGPFLVTNKPQTSPGIERTLASFPEQVHKSLCNAINTRHLVKFMYQGKPRFVEPHDYGIQHERARLLTYQLGGQSGSGCRTGVGSTYPKSQILKCSLTPFPEIARLRLADISNGTSCSPGWVSPNRVYNERRFPELNRKFPCDFKCSRLRP
jgi:hypothetical protein